MGAPMPTDGPPTGAERPERMLFIASAGGHVAELRRLAESVRAADDSLWVSFDGPQVRSVLDGLPARFIPYIAPRDVAGVLRAVRPLVRILRDGRFDRVISTGSAVAVSAFIAAALTGVAATYVESVARVSGPSLTGRIVEFLGLAELWTQHPGWRRRGWRQRPSVLRRYPSLAPVEPTAVGRPLKVFVTLGTIRPYRFDALLDAVLRSGFAGAQTVWQVGSTGRDDLPGTVVSQMSFEDFQRCALDADVVVTHAGVGSVIDLLDLGVTPIVVPRRARRGEHVDDHQQQIADHLRELGVAAVVDAEALMPLDLRVAAGRRAAVRR